MPELTHAQPHPGTNLKGDAKATSLSRRLIPRAENCPKIRKNTADNKSCRMTGPQGTKLPRQTIPPRIASGTIKILGWSTPLLPMADDQKNVRRHISSTNKPTLFRDGDVFQIFMYMYMLIYRSYLFVLCHLLTAPRTYGSHPNRNIPANRSDLHLV